MLLNVTDRIQAVVAALQRGLAHLWVWEKNQGLKTKLWEGSDGTTEVVS
jgi:hypothetical protein